MSTFEEDRIGRSVAVEKTYVHDVYDQISALHPEHQNTTPWPNVEKFLNELEPGSIVCDVGCGDGRYLKVNPSTFKIGLDRCQNLTQIVRRDDNEVLLCDNLTLPFRDESFDAVLSIAVIHHFATRDRRISALQELTRVLRIGGRLMITVWAMEEKDKKVGIQDILVQWHHPQFFRSPSSFEFSTMTTAASEENFVIPCRISQTHASADIDSILSRSSSLKQESRPGRSRLRLFQSLRSIKTSPSSSTLSSPNETCYSFFKRALQRFSRGNKKEKHQSRPWFLESWASFSRDDHVPATRYDPEGCEEDTDINDLPIELRRMENDIDSPINKTAASLQLLEINLTQKSKSLNDMLSQAEVASTITRSRSSMVTVDGYKIKIKTIEEKQADNSLKPILTRQKTSICEEELERKEKDDIVTDIKKKVNEMPMFKISVEKPEKYNVLKQQSLTDEIMSASRMKEKEEVIQNIHKQVSLNEDLIYRRQRRIDSLKDSFLTRSSKKFHMFHSGLTNKLKSSTTNIEKVTGTSLKSGIVKIFQGLTGSENVTPAETIPLQPTHSPQSVRKSSSEDQGNDFPSERRCSHEENSDSSKDSSLQSDTSVDSEDSIISVIERKIPKPEQTSPTMSMSPGPYPSKILTGVLSHPSSPKIPQIVQYPAGKTISLPASPRNIVLSPSLKKTFKIPPIVQITANGNGTIVTPNGKVLTSNGSKIFRDSSSNVAIVRASNEEEPILKLSPIIKQGNKVKRLGDKEMMLLSQKLSLLSSKEAEPRDDVCEGNESQKADSEQVLLFSKEQTFKLEEPVHTTNETKSIQTRKSVGTQSSLPPHMQSYELFNPETEDFDTDSSGFSTPDSVGSVISVKMESINSTPSTEKAQSEIEENKCPQSSETKETKECSISSLPSLNTVPKQSTPGICDDTPEKINVLSLTDSQILNTENESKFFVSISVSLNEKISSPLSEQDTMLNHEITVGNKAVIRDAVKQTDDELPLTPEIESWDIECKKSMMGMAENLSERILAEIDRYKEQSTNIEKEFSPFADPDSDPYFNKLSENYNDVSKLTEELSQDQKSSNETEKFKKISGYNVEIKQLESTENINDVILEEISNEEENESKNELQVSQGSGDVSTDAESPGSIPGWLDSRRNTIESGYRKDRNGSTEKEGTAKTVSANKKTDNTSENEECRRLSASESIRKLIRSDTTSQTRLSTESTDTVSEKTISSIEDNVLRNNTTNIESSSRLSVESDYCDIDRNATTSKFIEYKADSDYCKCSRSHPSLFRPGESIESSDTGSIISEFSRQNTQSEASLSDCSKDIQFADRRTARCDGRSSSEETNPRAMLRRQKAAIRPHSETGLGSAGTSLCKSTSQESLTSEIGDGSIFYSRYYHMFREGELEALMEEFVGNLHIISSYYDQTNWCIIAEKVRVWTI